MDIKEQFRIVQAVLNEVASREACYPDGDVADEIIEKVRALTGNDRFCVDVPAISDMALDSTFELRIETWENDADNYSTQVLTNLTAEDVKFYLDLAGNFNSRNDRDDPGYGNEEHDYETYDDLMHDLFLDHPDISQQTKDMWALDADNQEDAEARGSSYYQLLVQHVLGSPVDYDWGFARVFDSFKVFTVVDGWRVEATVQFS